MRVAVRIEGAGRAYTYEVDEPVKVGDLVRIPPNYITDFEQTATVVSLTTDYDGPVKWALKVNPA